MKTYVHFILIALFPCVIAAQTIKVEYDKDAETFTLHKCKNDDGTNCEVFKGDLTRNESYNVIISGINTAITKTIFKAKPFSVVSATPTIIQPILPGISNSGQLDVKNNFARNSPFKDLIAFSDEALDKYNLLIGLKKISNTLYKNTIFKIKNGQAITDFNNACSDFKINLGNIEDNRIQLNYTIAKHQHYIHSVKEIFTKRLENEKNVPIEIIERFSEVLLMAEAVSKDNFTKYANFLYQSISAKGQTIKKPFIAKGDGVDLNITLLNTYVNDTIANKTIDFYTKGNFSFDFSSGFFYSNKIQQSYYLQLRANDVTKKDIIEEPIRDFDISVGALGHFSYKFTSKFKAGISMGASLSPLDGKTRYLLGGSFIFGRKKQVAVNTGISFVKANVLSDAVSSDAAGNYVNATVTAVPTFEKIKNSFFIGLTYNLTSTKKYH